MIGRGLITSGSFVDDDGSSVCGLGSAFLVGMLFIMLFVVAHQTDEDRGEEHEDEGLQKRDEKLEERDQNGCDATAHGHSGDDSTRAAFGHEGRAKQQERGQEDMSADHVREESNGEGHRLDEDAGELDHEDHGDHDQQELGSLGQAAGEVVKPTQDAELAEAVDLNHHETHQCEGDRDVDVARGLSLIHI